MEEKELQKQTSSALEEKTNEEQALSLPKEDIKVENSNQNNTSEQSNSLENDNSKSQEVSLEIPKSKDENPTEDKKDISLPSIKGEKESSPEVANNTAVSETKEETTSNQPESNTPEPSNNDAQSSQEANNIVLPEAVDNTEKKVEAANPTLNTEANFSQIFNVESEETEPPVSSTPENNSSSNNEDKKVEENVNVAKNENTPAVEVTPKAVEEQPKSKFNREAFNNEEKVLYEIKPEKEGNPFIVLIFFVFLISFIIFLPTITKNTSLFNFFPKDTPETPQEEETNDGKYDLRSSSVRIKMDDLEFANFVDSKTNDTYRITFTMNNNGQTPYMFDKKYYIIFYDRSDSVVYRALIHSFEAIGSLSAQEVSLIITQKAYEEATKFKIEEIETSRYPSVNLIESEDEYRILTCTYQNDEMKYYFLNNQLSKIKETYKESRDNSLNYNSNLETYRSTSNRYKEIEGFQSTFVETGNDFEMLNEFNLKDIQDITLTNLHVYRFFKYNENKDIVSFEMEAQGYQCR